MDPLKTEHDVKLQIWGQGGNLDIVCEEAGSARHTWQLTFFPCKVLILATSGRNIS